MADLEVVLLESTLRCRGAALLRDSLYQPKNRLRVSKRELLDKVYPAYSLSVGNSERHVVLLGVDIKSISSYNAGSKIVLRLNYNESARDVEVDDDDDDEFFEIEFDSGRDGRHLQSEWEQVIKLGMASAICNHYYEPVGSEMPSLRLSEDRLEMAIYRLNGLEMGDKAKKMISQGEYLLKARRQMSELLMRLLNGGVDFISNSELERLQRLIAAKRDLFLSRDSDVKRVLSVYAAMKKLRATSTNNSNSAIEAHAMINEVVQSLVTFPIYTEELSSDFDDSSYYSSSSESTPIKYAKDEEVETGNDVYVEASSVTVCVAMPMKRDNSKKQESQLPIATESPKKYIQVASPVKRKSPRSVYHLGGAADAKRKLFEITSASSTPLRSIFVLLGKWAGTIIFSVLLIATFLSTPSSFKEDNSLTKQSKQFHQEQASESIPIVVSRGMEVEMLDGPQKVISIVPCPTIHVVWVKGKPISGGNKSQSPWFSRLWNHAKQSRRNKKIAAEAIFRAQKFL